MREARFALGQIRRSPSDRSRGQADASGGVSCAQSVETLRSNGNAMRYVAEAFKHAKPIAAIADGVSLLREAPLHGVQLSDNGLVVDAGVVSQASVDNGSADAFTAALAEAITGHRHFDRRLDLVPA